MSGVNQAEENGSAELAGAPYRRDVPSRRPARRRRRRHRRRRIALISLGSVFALIVVAVAGAYATINHYASDVKRIPGVFTELVQQLDGIGHRRGSMVIECTRDHRLLHLSVDLSRLRRADVGRRLYRQSICGKALPAATEPPVRRKASSGR